MTKGPEHSVNSKSFLSDKLDGHESSVPQGLEGSVMAEWQKVDSVRLATKLKVYRGFGIIGIIVVLISATIIFPKLFIYEFEDVIGLQMIAGDNQINNENQRPHKPKKVHSSISATTNTDLKATEGNSKLSNGINKVYTYKGQNLVPNEVINQVSRNKVIAKDKRISSQRKLEMSEILKNDKISNRSSINSKNNIEVKEEVADGIRLISRSGDIFLSGVKLDLVDISPKQYVAIPKEIIDLDSMKTALKGNRSLTPYAIFHGGLAFTHRMISNKNQTIAQGFGKEYFDSFERGTFNQQLGAELGIQIKKLNISIGIDLLEYETIHKNQEAFVQVDSVNDEYLIYTSLGSISLNEDEFDDENDDFNLGVNISSRNRFLSLPIMIGYQFAHRKFSFEPRVGVVISNIKALSDQIVIEDDEFEGEYEHDSNNNDNGNSGFQINNWSLGTAIQTRFEYALSPQIGINFSTSFNRSFTSLNQSSFKVYSYSFSNNLGIRIKF